MVNTMNLETYLSGFDNTVCIRTDGRTLQINKNRYLPKKLLQVSVEN